MEDWLGSILSTPTGDPFPSAIAIQEVMSPGEWSQTGSVARGRDEGKRAACAGNLEPTVVEDLSHVTFSIQLGEWEGQSYELYILIQKNDKLIEP